MNVDRYMSLFDRTCQVGKPRKFLNAKHIEFVRSRPCVVTWRRPVVAHHVQTRGKSQNDYLTVPLVPEQHDFLHLVGRRTFEERNGVDLRDALIATLIERIMDLEASVPG